MGNDTHGSMGNSMLFNKKHVGKYNKFYHMPHVKSMGCTRENVELEGGGIRV